MDTMDQENISLQQVGDEAYDETQIQVLERLEIFSKDGGYVCNTIHNIQANTPIPNIVAMVDAIKEFNGDK